MTDRLVHLQTVETGPGTGWCTHSLLRQGQGLLKEGQGLVHSLANETGPGMCGWLSHPSSQQTGWCTHRLLKGGQVQAGALTNCWDRAKGVWMVQPFIFTIDRLMHSPADETGAGVCGWISLPSLQQMYWCTHKLWKVGQGLMHSLANETGPGVWIAQSSIFTTDRLMHSLANETGPGVWIAQSSIFTADRLVHSQSIERGPGVWMAHNRQTG
ncbi:hypothetical protein BOTBODRAFT_630092 [Botryobasidium botryosum FD-172 SS1]|uniref:Uncharacterized protein n=1 Tax=Botryobasidium botryosum (strain FD-172 SS1) TaxID=930990 RepID=A0A067MDX0_BOTB1|nr:hypothetical protein BOTBODRAFT_630092 [Botryobasidium botryosum FD-172 SS1]